MRREIVQDARQHRCMGFRLLGQLRRFTPWVGCCALLPSGCAQLTTETKVEETVWQVANAVDGVQTYMAVGEQPCRYHEFGLLSHVAGSHPGKGTIVAWQTGLAALHFGFTFALSGRGGESYDDIRPWVLRIWEIGTIAQGLQGPVNNYQAAGDRFFVRSGHCP